MPYQYPDSQELYMEYIGKISALVEDSSTSKVILLGDFNADIITLFETELIEIRNSLDLLISDYKICGRCSGLFTRVSDAHNFILPHGLTIFCTSTEHKLQIDQFYMQLYTVLEKASRDSIPS